MGTYLVTCHAFGFPFALVVQSRSFRDVLQEGDLSGKFMFSAVLAMEALYGS
jgi:hypothetical protein